jgi:RNA polymerase sigma-70 factor (ECF subfamily)
MDPTRHSLLLRAQVGDEHAWSGLTALYRPLILGWLRRQGVPASELDDLTQEVLLVVVKSLPSFEHSGRRGAFRAWLRSIVCQRACNYWRTRDRHGLVQGGSAADDALHQLEDPQSDLNRQWDEEHDRSVLQSLLGMVEQEFEPNTRHAFRRLALEGASAAEVSQELGLSLPAVYVAKSRVLQRLRQEAEGILD